MDGYYASDLDGDALEMDLSDQYARRSYNAAVTVLTTSRGMYLDRHQVERLRDFCDDVLAQEGTDALA